MVTIVSEENVEVCKVSRLGISYSDYFVGNDTYGNVTRPHKVIHVHTTEDNIRRCIKAPTLERKRRKYKYGEKTTTKMQRPSFAVSLLLTFSPLIFR